MKIQTGDFFFFFSEIFDYYINKTYDPDVCENWTQNFINDKPIDELNNVFLVNIRYIV